MIKKYKVLVAIACVLAMGMSARAQDAKTKYAPTVDSIVAESSPIPSLTEAAQQSDQQTGALPPPPDGALPPLPDGALPPPPDGALPPSHAGALPPPPTAQPTGKELMAGPPSMPPMSAEMMKAAAINAQYKDLGMWDWDVMPAPMISDSILGDAGGIRPAFAKNHLWFVVFESATSYDNMLHAPMYGADGKHSDGKFHSCCSNNPNDQGYGTTQSYSGQKPAGTLSSSGYLTYTLERTQTQFSVGVVHPWTSMMPIAFDDVLRFADISVTQRFMDKKLKLMAGYLATGYQTQGTFIGGNMAGSLLGMNSMVNIEAGQGMPAATIHPAVVLRYTSPTHYYFVSGVERSSSPTAGTNSWHDPLYLPFSVKGTKALLLDEVGYNRVSAPGVKRVWERFDGFFNFTHYTDYSKVIPVSAANPTGGFGKSNNNWAFSQELDVQVTQPHKFEPFRGLYLGGAAQYAPPKIDTMCTQYYELRAYYTGLFKKRPLDLLTVMANSTLFSKVFIKNVEKPISIIKYDGTTDDTQMNFAVTYVGRVGKGLWGNIGADYVLHPTMAPKTPTALVATASLMMYF